MDKNIYKKKNKTLSIINTILINLLLSFLITIVSGFVMGYKFLNIVTASMTPTMPVGTIVIVKHIPITQVKVGDVVTYKSGTSNVTHRVVEKINTVNGSARLKTKGDATTAIDQYPVTDQNFVGVVICHFKGLGYLFDLIKNNIIMITIAVVLALFIVTYS